MQYPRPVFGSSLSNNVSIIPPAGQATTLATLKIIPKSTLTNMQNKYLPSGKENRQPLPPARRVKKAYSRSPGHEYNISPRLPSLTTNATNTTNAKPGLECIKGTEYIPIQPRSIPPTPKSLPPSNDLPSSEWPKFQFDRRAAASVRLPPPTSLTYTPATSFLPSPSHWTRLPVPFTQHEIVHADDIRWKFTFDTLDALHARSEDDDGYWMWRAEVFKERARAKAEERERGEPRAALMRILCGYPPSTYEVAPKPLSTKTDPIPVYHRAVDDRTMSGLFLRYGYDYDYGFDAGYAHEPVNVYMIPTPAEKYAPTSESWLSSSPLSSSSDGPLTDTESPNEDVCIAHRSPLERDFPSEVPVDDVLTYQTTHESQRAEYRDRMIALFAARAKQVGPTCDDVDEAEYSDDGCESEDGEGVADWADDELSVEVLPCSEELI